MRDYVKLTVETIELRPEERLAAGSDLGGGGKDNCAATPANSGKPECTIITESTTTPSHQNQG